MMFFNLWGSLRCLGNTTWLTSAGITRSERAEIQLSRTGYLSPSKAHMEFGISARRSNRLRKARSKVAVCSDRAHAPRHRHKTWLFLRIRFKGAHVQFWAGLTLTTEDSVNSASNPYSCNMALEVFWQNWRIKWLWRSRTQAILQVKSSNWSLNNWSAQALANSSALRFPSLRSGFWFLHRPWAATFKTVAVPSRRVSALHTDSQKHNWNKTACCFLWLNQPSPIGLIKYLPIVRA